VSEAARPPTRSPEFPAYNDTTLRAAYKRVVAG